MKGGNKVKKETAKQETKRLIGELFGAENVSCDMNYLMGELYNQGQITQEQYNQITIILQQKRNSIWLILFTYFFLCRSCLNRTLAISACSSVISTPSE